MNVDLPSPYDDRILLLFRAIYNGDDIPGVTMADSKEIFRHCCAEQYRAHVRLIHRAYPINHSHARQKYGSYVGLLMDILNRHVLVSVANHN
jgi:hypothetical protein